MILIVSIFLLSQLGKPQFGTVSIGHYLFQDTRDIEFSLKANPEEGDLFVFNINTSTKEDRFLDQSTKYLEGSLITGVPLSFGLVSFTLGGFGNKQRRKDFRTEEREGRVGVGINSKFLSHWEIECKTERVISSFIKSKTFTNNNGFYFTGRLGRSSGSFKTFLRLNYDLRKITQQRYIFLEGTLSTGRLKLSLSSQGLKDVYPLSKKTEVKSRRGLGTAVNIITPLHGVTLLLSGRINGLSYQRESSKSNITTEAFGIFNISRKVFNWDASLAYYHGQKLVDYRKSPFDESIEERDLTFTLIGLIRNISSTTIKGNFNLKRTNYPQGERPDDRDERLMETSVESHIRFHGLILISKLIARRQDLLFLRGLRSASSRTTDHYKISSTVVPGLPYNLTFRWEISALYSIFRFKPENNILLRYLEFETKGGDSLLGISFKIRWQDQGRYQKELNRGWSYLRTRISRELWSNLSLLIFHMGNVKLYIKEQVYFRKQRSPDGGSIYMMHEYRHLAYIQGNGLTANFGVVKRRGEKSFPEVDIGWKKSF